MSVFQYKFGYSNVRKDDIRIPVNNLQRNDKNNSITGTYALFDLCWCSVFRSYGTNIFDRSSTSFFIPCWKRAYCLLRLSPKQTVKTDISRVNWYAMTRYCNVLTSMWNFRQGFWIILSRRRKDVSVKLLTIASSNGSAGSNQSHY